MGTAREQGDERRDLLFLLALWVYATGLNLLKPFHMDDTAHLLIAQHVAEDPLHPLSGQLNWLDTAVPIFTTNQPHLFFYLMSAVNGLFGTSELALHLLISVFTLTAIVAVHRLAVRFVPNNPLWVTLPFVLGPGFLINQNVMTDMPVLALICVAVLWATKPGARGAGVAFSVFAAAILTKYSALLALPALIWAAARRRSSLIYLLLPVAAIVAWSLFNLWDYGAVHILDRPGNVGGIWPSPKLGFTLLCNLGLFALPGAVFLIISGNRRYESLIAFMAGSVVFFLFETIGLGNNISLIMLPNAALFAGTFVMGIAAIRRVVKVLFQVIKVNEQRMQSQQYLELTFAVWLATGMYFFATFPPFMASRHALIIAPPLMLLGLAGHATARRSRVGVAGLLVWAIFGLFVTANDIAFARFYRSVAPVAGALAQAAARPGEAVYVRGHWGWQWYIAETGAVEFDSVRSQLLPGDIVIDPVGISSQTLPNIESFAVLGELQNEASFPRILDTWHFYASGAEPAPVIALAPIRRVRILRVPD